MIELLLPLLLLLVVWVQTQLLKVMLHDRTWLFSMAMMMVMMTEKMW